MCGCMRAHNTHEYVHVSCTCNPSVTACVCVMHLCDIQHVLCAMCYVYVVFLLVFLQLLLFTSAVCFSLFVFGFYCRLCYIYQFMVFVFLDSLPRLSLIFALTVPLATTS